MAKKTAALFTALTKQKIANENLKLSLTKLMMMMMMMMMMMINKIGICCDLYQPVSKIMFRCGSITDMMAD